MFRHRILVPKTGGFFILVSWYDIVYCCEIICFRVFFFIAEICLLAGSARNAYHTKYRTLLTDTPPSCQMLRRGVFAAGAAFIFFTSIVSQFYYVCYSRARESFQSYNKDTGIGMSTYK